MLNGGLMIGSAVVPAISKIARSLLQTGDAAKLALTTNAFWTAVQRPNTIQRAMTRLERPSPWLNIVVKRSGTRSVGFQYRVRHSFVRAHALATPPLGVELDRLQQLSDPVAARAA